MAENESSHTKILRELEAARAANRKVRRDARERVAELQAELQETHMQAMHVRSSQNKLRIAGNNLMSAIERGDADLIDQAVAEWKKVTLIMERER